MNDAFLRACRGEKTPFTPIWIMRQAGRYLPQYQKIRADVDFLTLCKTPELAATVTKQPVDILGVDAAILFSDILIPAEKMGLELHFPENGGPVFKNPVRDIAAAKALRVIQPQEDVPYVLETIKILVKELNVPLIGFAGAPFTVLTYIVEGGGSKNFIHTKTMMHTNPALFNTIMDVITQSTIAYLSAQIEAGVHAIQLFDTWAGVLSATDYRNWVFPYVKKTINALTPPLSLVQPHLGVPIIYFVNNCAGILHIAADSGADVIGVDWRIDIDDAINRSRQMPIQGNLDPCVLFSTRPYIQVAAKSIVLKASGAKGHIFNLGHGILPETPVDNVKALVDTVHEMKK
ncbi:MAG: uroporphyrinogen decarboxylase [Nitrospirae bacterium]|nr:uroporphyrinogen decarboxylase [Nitrospirota bacterium]